MPQEKVGGKTVSEKSTKGEIWEAYNAMLSGISDQPKLEFSSEKQESNKIAKTIEDLRTKFNSDISLVSEDIGTELADFADFADRLNKKKIETIKEIESKKEALEEEIEKAKKAWLENEAEKSKTQSREDEDYNYNLNQKRRKEEDEYKTIRALDKAEIAEKKAELDKRKIEIGLMEKELAKMPETIENAISEAVRINTENLTSAHLAEMKELKLIESHEQKISVLKIEEMAKKISEQTKTIEKLEKELAIANREAKQIAISVIESHGSGPIPQEIEA